jgi:hypothetical protein
MCNRLSNEGKKTMKQDIYQKVTDKIVADLEKGVSGRDTQVNGTVADEVVEVIRLPKLEASANRKIPPTLTRLTYRRRPSRSWKTTSRL